MTTLTLVIHAQISPVISPSPAVNQLEHIKRRIARVEESAHPAARTQLRAFLRLYYLFYDFQILRLQDFAAFGHFGL